MLFTLLVIIQIVFTTIAGSIILSIPKYRKKYRIVVLGAFCGIAIVALLSLAGLYANGKVVGEFNNGGTWIPSKSLDQALVHSLDSPSFVASFFGYSCNTTYGENCSEALYTLGFLSVEAVLIGSAVAGRKLGNVR